MKKALLGLMVVATLLVSTPAFADTNLQVLPYHRHSYSLQFANDYARAIDTFQIDGRTFLVQQNPQTLLEIKTRIYWESKQKVDAMRAELVQTW